MSTSPSDGVDPVDPVVTGRRGARAGSLGLALLLVPALALSGCSGDDARSTAVTPTASSTPAAPAAPVSADPLIGQVTKAPDVLAALQRTLGHRGDAVVAGDLAEFDDGVAPGRADFAAQQQQYFANLRQLPLQAFTLTADPATLVRDGAAYAVNVSVTMQLAGFDAVPVTTTDRYRFAPTAGGRRYRLTSVTDADWEARNHVQSQPWDTGAIQVRSGTGVLGIFDAGSVGAAEPLLRSVEAGIADVSARVPYDWSRSVVVYALSDDTFLRSVPDLPGGDPEELDAVAYPVADAGTRLVLHPRMLARGGAARDRLLRHELVHAAVGTHDDHAPVWLGEGLAEWVSVQAQAPEDRTISKAALAAARRGPSDLPGDDGFNDGEAAEHYALSWWACEYAALTAGGTAPWTLLDQLDALGAQGPVDRADEDATLTALVGVNMRTLARKAAKLMVTTFEPPPPTPTPVVPLPVPVVPTTPGTPPAPAAPAAPAPTPAAAPAG